MIPTSIDVNKIISIAHNLLRGREIMFMYLGGSVAYGTFAEGKSDVDVNVFVRGMNGYTHADIDNIDYFIYGEDIYLKKQKLESDLSLFNVIFTDDTLSAKENLIYLNTKYQDEFNEFLSIKLECYFKKLINAYINFFEYYYKELENPSKIFYHVFRVYGIILAYKETNTLTLNIKEPWKTKMLIYKENWNNDIGKSLYLEINEIIQKIKKLEEEL